MVGFGARLEAERRPEWAEDFLDYGSLKRLIRACRQAQEPPGAAAQQPAEKVGSSGGDSTGRQAPAPRELESAKQAFQQKLDAEVLKVIGFYRSKSQELQQAVAMVAAEARALLAAPAAELISQLSALSRASMGAGRAEPERATALGRLSELLQATVHETTHLLQFIALNMTGIRKILKKYAKHAATVEPAPGMLALEVEHPDDPGWRVLQGTFLPARVADDLADMQQHAGLKAAMHQLQGLVAEVAEARAAVAEHSSLRVPSLIDSRLEAVAGEVEEMLGAEEEASRHSALVHARPWAERAAGMFEPPPPDAYAVATTPGLVANNLSTLLYMTNYTAVLPPVDALCVRLGVPSSYAGHIMAASDLAALFTSVGISFWIQHSFKQPLLFAAASCLAGNVLFVLSFQRRSLALLLLARLLNGLGSARAANRRYTADYVPKAKRTMASAAFVGASNLGMAMGPLLSLPLAYRPAEGGPSFSGVPLNPITAVGLVMAVFWLAFLGGAALWFHDPPARVVHIGLARPSLITPVTRLLTRLSIQRGSSFRSGAGLQPRSSLQQPLLAAGPADGSGEDSAPGQAAAEAGAARGLAAQPATPAPAAGEPAAAAPASGELQRSHSWLLPHAERAMREKEGEAGGKGRPAARAAWRATVAGTAACTLALFVQKLVQQSYLDSLPALTGILYGWSTSQKGAFIGLVSLAMVPVNAAVGAASSRLSDRSMVLGSLLLCVLCCAALTRSVGSSLSFFGGGVLLFVGSVVLEGTATSLMSKVIWSGFSQGVLNAGLLSTEAGTLGRFAGNAMLAVAGRATGLEDRQQLAAFCQLLFLTLTAACVALLVHLTCIYRRLRG